MKNLTAEKNPGTGSWKGARMLNLPRIVPRMWLKHDPSESPDHQESDGEAEWSS
jgi:hypothetical protein